MVEGYLMKYEVIDNFLDKEYFDSLKNLFFNKESMDIGAPMPLPHPVSWEFEPHTVVHHKKLPNEKVSFQVPNLSEDTIFYMVHKIYDFNIPMSNAYNNLIPLLDKLKMKALVRIKANLYPNTEMIHEHPMHEDYDYCHSAAIFSLNTCDGYTKLKDGTKIGSVANRILFFDAGEAHCSTTTTNVKARFNLNINYL